MRSDHDPPVLDIDPRTDPGTGHFRSRDPAGPITIEKGHVPTGCLPRVNSVEPQAGLARASAELTWVEAYILVP